MNFAPDWDIAEDHLDKVAEDYEALGMAGILGLAVIHKIRAQYDAGERTPELYQRIMEIQ